MSVSKVVIAGSSSHLTPSVLKHLHAASIPTTLLVREGSKAPDNLPPNVEIVRVPGSYAAEALEPLLRGHEAVVSLLGSAALTKQQRSLADAAAAAGVKYFLPSDFGTDFDDDAALRKEIPIFAEKYAVHEYLETKRAAGLNWISVVAGSFWDFCLPIGMLGPIPAKQTAKVFGDGKAPFITSSFDFVGQTVAAILRQPAGLANRVVVSYELQASPIDLVHELERQTGQKYTVEHEDAAKQRATAKAGTEAGDIGAMYGLIYNENMTNGDYSHSPKRVMDQLGLKGRSLSEMVADWVATQNTQKH